MSRRSSGSRTSATRAGDRPSPRPAAEAGVFDAEAEEVGSLVAAHAAVDFADAQQIKHLHDALATRDLIGQAKGILMERFTITAPQAFLVLTTASSRTHIKLRAVAEQLATTGTLPDTTP